VIVYSFPQLLQDPLPDVTLEQIDDVLQDACEDHRSQVKSAVEEKEVQLLVGDGLIDDPLLQLEGENTEEDGAHNQEEQEKLQSPVACQYPGKKTSLGDWTRFHTGGPSDKRIFK
jgi:hypothetical protein